MMETPVPHQPSAPAVEELELGLLLEALVQCYGYDFRGHDRAALRHKLAAAMAQLGARTISLLQDRVLHDPGALATVLRALHVPPAALFDDAQEVAQLRAILGACLHGAALPKVWLADCAGAMQAWTLAILLHEQQLDNGTEIFATVPSDEQLADAQDASVALADLPVLQENYARCGGQGALLDHFVVQGAHAVLLPQLRSRITWAQYNLVTDASCNEFQLIVCRRALPDFGPVLRRRVLQLFHDSLAPFGVLGLDRPLEADDTLAASYQPLLPPLPWYRRTV
ncbi:chemotaxis protein [Duganella sp. LX20W]|uniref:Chemotaxis protein n=1 Tax=Rugamonas brunnea TaxID=2758569 RepID=A0A7W2IBX1_9BURK|nr:CheR family methyltransferase [Rugamonas brunnea]MBA5637976.1 chemotaxis protein [Rugamonas brunnea]